MRTFTLDLAGQPWSIEVSQAEISAVHLPLLRWCARQASLRQGRTLVLLAGPPGCGKTALAALWERLAREQPSPTPLQALPMDGFHYPNSVLEQRQTLRGGSPVQLSSIKGAPETFDLDGLRDAVAKLRSGSRLRWPAYDRRIHDPVPDALVVIDRGTIVLEGNYLLLDEPGWREQAAQADLRLFLECPQPLLFERVMARAQRGGRSRASAARHYERSDRPNVERVMSNRLAADIVLRAAADGTLEIAACSLELAV